MAVDLSRKPRRPIGLRAKDFQFSSLHQHRPVHPIKNGILTEEDIHAAPVSSDEEFLSKQEEEDGLSDDSLPAASGIKRRSSPLETLGNGEHPKSITEKDKENAPELQIPPSTVPHSTWKSRKGYGSRSGSQASQKKADEDEDVDPMSSFSSQPKRLKRYSSSSQPLNIHLSGASNGKTKSKKENKNATNAQKTGKKFHIPDTASMHSMLDNREASLGKSVLKQSDSTSSSPRSQGASQRSTQNTQTSAEGSQKPEFKVPRKLTPKKRKCSPTFRPVPVLDEEASRGRVTRSSRCAGKTLTPADPNTSSTTKNAASVAAEKLGISMPQLVSPTSPASLSFTHPTSLDTANPASSPLGNPPIGSTPEESYCIISEDIPIFTKQQESPLCPFCREPVDKLFLEEKMKVGRRLTIRQQAQFCKDHKRRAADDEWTERGYPTIDWPKFDDRLNQYHSALDDILRKQRKSYYRNAFEDLVKSGKNWTWQQDVMSGNRIEELSPGYYGGRGAKLMCAPIICDDFNLLIIDRMENIMLKFAGKMRRLANSDILISTGGVSGFVQAVLVPELAVMLVQADMNIDDEEAAREVLRNSVDIGHLLNEEEDELIQDPDIENEQVINEQ